MRCPDCGKFVSMENGEPDVNLECEYSDGSFQISGEIHHARNCADCSTELKSIDLSPDVDVELHQFEDFDKLSAADQQAFKLALDKGEASIECDPEDGEVEESGGGRYQKNIITVRVPFTITVKATVSKKDPGPVTLTYSGEVSEENPASAYEECC